MNLTDELARLAEMHEQGQLSEEEFLQAKRRVLTEAPNQTSLTGSKPPRTLAAPSPVSRTIVSVVQPSATDAKG